MSLTHTGHILGGSNKHRSGLAMQPSTFVIAGMTFAAFVGDVFVHPTFSRGDQESTRVFRRALTAPARNLPMHEMWRAAADSALHAGLSIQRIDESVWGDEICFILVDHNGRQPRGVGYYCHGEIWLARQCRGRGLEVQMILCAAGYTGGSPVGIENACLTPEEYAFHKEAFDLLTSSDVTARQAPSYRPAEIVAPLLKSATATRRPIAPWLEHAY